MSCEEAAWAEIRVAYEAGEETVSALAKRLRVSEGAIYRRVRRDGWARRSNAKRGSGATSAKTGGSGSGGARNAPVKDRSKIKNTADDGSKHQARRQAASSLELIDRLYNAMDAKLKRLEARMHSNEPLTLADSERETRELGSMIRSFEKVTAFAASIEERDKPAKRGKPAIAPGDAERMREEIAERLERLCAEQEAAKQAGQTQ